MNCYIVCFSLSSSFTMSPIHGVLDLATNYFRPKHTLYAINCITCRFQNCTGRHWSSSTAVGINWQTAEDILDAIHYTTSELDASCRFYIYRTRATAGMGGSCGLGEILIAEANVEIADVSRLFSTLFIVYFWFQIGSLGVLVGVLSETISIGTKPNLRESRRSCFAT